MLANAIDLTTLSSVKGLAEIGSSGDDGLIQAIITGFSQYVLTRTGRDSLNSVVIYTEIYDGNGGDRLFLRNSPIVSVTSLMVDGNLMQAQAQYGSAGYFIEQSKKSLAVSKGFSGSFISSQFPSSNFPFIFRKDRGNIQVIYSAGYLPTPVVNERQTVAANTIPLNNSPWASDQGVSYYPSLTPLVLVAMAPAAGQYAVSNGLYVFNNADNDANVVVSYKYNAAPADLEYACREACSTFIKRKGWQDLASKTLSAQGGTGTTRYRDWHIPPGVERVILSYTRTAVV